MCSGPSPGPLLWVCADLLCDLGQIAEALWISDPCHCHLTPIRNLREDPNGLRIQGRLLKPVTSKPSPKGTRGRAKEVGVGEGDAVPARRHPVPGPGMRRASRWRGESGSGWPHSQGPGSFILRAAGTWENEPPETMEETSPELMLPRERRQEERGQLLGKFGRFPCRPQALSVTRCERNIRVVDGNRRGLTQVKIEISCFRGAWLERCTADTFPIAVSTILSAVVCRIDVNIVGSAPRSGPAATAWPALPPAHSASEMFEGKTAGAHVRLGSVPAPAPSSPGTEWSPEEVAPAQAAQEAEAPLLQCGPEGGQEASLPSLETASGVFLLTFLIVYLFYGYFYFLV
nr:uncharacterized protein LOC101414677 isoform X1 [Dasypus novemcinctus]